MAASSDSPPVPSDPPPSRRPFSGVEPAKVRPYIWLGAGLLAVAAILTSRNPVDLTGFGGSCGLMVVAGIGLELSVRSGPSRGADEEEPGEERDALTGEPD